MKPIPKVETILWIYILIDQKALFESWFLREKIRWREFWVVVSWKLQKRELIRRDFLNRLWTACLHSERHLRQTSSGQCETGYVTSWRLWLSIRCGSGSFSVNVCVNRKLPIWKKQPGKNGMMPWCKPTALLNCCCGSCSITVTWFRKDKKERISELVKIESRNPWYVSRENCRPGLWEIKRKNRAENENWRN